MLKQGTTTAAADAETRRQACGPSSAGTSSRCAEARVSVMTHAFNYGTAVFEGIRAYWNADQEQLYGARPARRTTSAFIGPRGSFAGAAAHPRGARRNHRRAPSPRRAARGRLRPADLLQVERGDRRPASQPGVRPDHLRDPVRQVHRHRGGIRAQVCTWRRTDDNAIPARSKITGSYVNGALRQVRGPDERLRRGDHPDPGGPCQRGERREPVHRARGDPHDARR